MDSRSRVAADANPFSSEWAPRLLRLFNLYNGDNAVAESLTIDTLVEHAARRRVLSTTSSVELLRFALVKAASARTGESFDPVVSAVISLPPDQRAAIVLFRGLSLDVQTVAAVMELDVSQVKALCTRALLAMQESLRQDRRLRDVPPAPLNRGELPRW